MEIEWQSEIKIQFVQVVFVDISIFCAAIRANCICHSLPIAYLTLCSALNNYEKCK